MKKSSSIFLFLILLLGACSGTRAIPQPAATQEFSAADTAANDEASTDSVDAEPGVSSREALISEIENDVLVRVSPDGELAPASVGVSVRAGGSIKTGDESRATIKLIPDGTLIRVGPNSSFTFSSLVEENGAPKTVLQLFFGQIFILLDGGSLDVETSSGVASVRGSLMGVTLSMDAEYMSITCLEGHCQCRDDDEELEMTEGEAADLVGGNMEDEIRDMTFEELGLWVLDNPDLQEYVEELPDLPGVPEDFDWNYDFNSDPEFEFYYDPEYNPGEELSEPTLEPTEEPTGEPTEVPTGEPTEVPKDGGDPTGEPTEVPTGEPTEVPKDGGDPKEEPTGEPTEAPTDEPTEAPTDEPTEAPTDKP